MPRVLIIFALFFATFPAHASVTASQSQTAPSSEQAEYARKEISLAYRHIRDNDLTAAVAALDNAIESEGFATMPEETRYFVLLLAAQANDERGDRKAAYPQWVRASAFRQADAATWIKRLSAAFALMNYQDSAECVITIATRWRTSLDRIHAPAIFQIAAKLEEDEALAAQHKRLLESLFDANWTDKDGEEGIFWRDLARILLASGDTERAATVGARVKSARVALTMRVDKRFDAITQGNLDHYDVDRLAAEALAAARSAMEAAPDMLRPKTRLQQLLLDTLQNDQVLAIADDIIARVKDGGGESTYEDFDDQYVWVLDMRARALVRLGRWDEATEQLARAARRPENGSMNVSQALNLGWYYAHLGEPSKALDVVSELGPMSPYGRMQLEMVKFMAALQQKDAAAVATHLAYMREHRADAIGTWQNALLDAGDLDAAGDLLAERLRSEKWRSDALAAMQRYADVKGLPVDSERLARWQEVLAQPKVTKALAEVGRIETFAIAE
jgi:tetratricopeptide (TPR) repeat protein